MHLDYRIISSAIFVFRIDKTRIVGVKVRNQGHTEREERIRRSFPVAETDREGAKIFSFFRHIRRRIEFILSLFSFLVRCHRHGTCKTSCPSFPPSPPLPFSSDGIHLKITGAGSLFPAQIKKKKNPRHFRTARRELVYKSLNKTCPSCYQTVLQATRDEQLPSGETHSILLFCVLPCLALPSYIWISFQ